MKPPIILVAEYDADDRYLLQTAFEESGFTEKLHFVENGMELFTYLNSNTALPSGKQLPHIILPDLNMPKKDGREVLKELKQHPLYKKIPIVIFTTTHNENEIKRCYELGANTYIVKPVSFDRLLDTIQSIRNYWMKTAAVL